MRGGTSHGRLLRAADPLPNSLRPGGALARTPRPRRGAELRVPPGPPAFNPTAVDVLASFSSNTRAGFIPARSSRIRAGPRPCSGAARETHHPSRGRRASEIERNPGVWSTLYTLRSLPTDAGRARAGAAVGHPCRPRLERHVEMAWRGSRSPRSPRSHRSMVSLVSSWFLLLVLPLRSGPGNATAPDDPGPWSAARGASTEGLVTSRGRRPGLLPERLPGPCRGASSLRHLLPSVCSPCRALRRGCRR